MLEYHNLCLSKDKVLSLWQKYQQVPLAFADEWRDVRRFYDFLSSPNNVFVEIGEELGLVSVVNVRPGLDGFFNVVMFDRKVSGREDTFKRIILEIFELTKNRRLTVMIPGHMEVMRKLALRLEFQPEGRMRDAYVYDGKFEDVFIFGLIRNRAGFFED